MHTETDKAYIAGLVDGEGHIAINLRSGKWKGHQVMIKITNTNMEVLEEIARDYGATTSKHRARGYWKPTMDIYWSARRAVEFLRQIRPYLRIKAEIADVALAFAETVRKPNAKARAITEEEWNYREELRLQIRTLNLRSGAEIPTPVESPQVTRGTQTCQWCKSKFTANRKRKYCSDLCRGRQRMEWDKERRQKQCPSCGEIFGGPAPQIYCSRKCWLTLHQTKMELGLT